jgi:hypothetical protein
MGYPHKCPSFFCKFLMYWVLFYFIFQISLKMPSINVLWIHNTSLKDLHWPQVLWILSTSFDDSHWAQVVGILSTLFDDLHWHADRVAWGQIPQYDQWQLS